MADWALTPPRWPSERLRNRTEHLPECKRCYAVSSALMRCATLTPTPTVFAAKREA
jgi:hypothetical protein